MRTSPQRRSASSLELLEARIAPAIIVLRSGAAPNFNVSFTDDGTGDVDNNLTLRFASGSNNLEFSTDGGITFSPNLGAANTTATFGSIATINVHLGGAADDQFVFALSSLPFSVDLGLGPDTLLETQFSLNLAPNESVLTNVSGAETIFINGDGNDTLTVESATGDNHTRIQKAARGNNDELVSSAMTSKVEFAGLADFVFGHTNHSGTNVVTFATQYLSGAAKYETALLAGDTLIVEGGDATNDTFTLFRTPIGETKVTDSISNVSVSEISSGGTARIEVHGLGGDDQLNVNVGAAIGSNVIPNPIFFDGGSGTDLTDVFGAPASAVDEFIYQPGLVPGASTLRYENAGNARLMGIESANVEAVADLVNVTKLTVNGTDAAEAITYSASKIINPGGRVAIGAAGALEFSNKMTLTLNGLGGSDEITLDNALGSPPPGLNSIVVAGGDGLDSLIVHGNPGKNTITYIPTAADGATIQGLPNVPITTTTMESVLIRGGGGNDALHVNGTGAPDFIAFTPGQAIDAGGVRVDSLLPLSFAELGATGTVVIGGSGGDVLDYAGTDAADVFTIANGAIALAQHNPAGAVLTGTTHVAVIPLAVQSVQLRGLAGNDLLHTAGGAVTFAFNFDGGSDQPDPIASGQAFGSATGYTAGRKPGAFTTGDVNADGFTDLVVANTGDGTISVLLGNGAGGFGDATTFSAGGKTPNGLILRDLDSDGTPDLAVTIAGKKPLAIFLNDGAGNYGLPGLIAIPGVTAPKLTALAVGELDGNNLPELVALNSATKVVVFTNNGAGGFTAKTPVATGGKGGVDLVLADFNGDGNVDVATANALTSNVSFLANDGTGLLGAATRYATGGVRPSALAAADFDGDGILDLAVTHTTSHFVTILSGNGGAAGPQFKTRVKIATPGSKSPRDLVAADLDGDGRADLIFANGGANSFSVMLGLAGGTFRRPIETVFSDEKGQASVALALADFNRDGLLDVALLIPAAGDVDIALRLGS
ncbi:MAG TPA: VCBS repeat-containing protein [Chthoniobacteraceae bacterium]|jgi:hypothetical protein|nr:VCBS repeat-containing protein [Chthoniobacteraceae bacterium]